MSNREFFIKTWEKEQPAFVRVFEAVPEGQLAYKPHDRSSAAGPLAWQIVQEQRTLAALLKSGVAPWPTDKHPEKVADISKAWKSATDEMRSALQATDDQKWAGPVKITMGEGQDWASTAEKMMWDFLLDMIHHRGQLSAYLRPMGGKVPSIYGPSGDTK